MKYLILLCDGMADLPIEELDFITPMAKAYTPNMDKLAQIGYTGMVKTVPVGVPPGSDTANMSVMGYDPLIYYTGRSPIEAISMGLDLNSDDVAFRVNLVTLSDEDNYSDKTMLDYSSDEITTSEANELIDAVNIAFSNELMHYYSGKSYRHCMIWKNGPIIGNLVPPHDILTKQIKDFLPMDNNFKILTEIMKQSYSILNNHPVNKARILKGLNPANSIWLWGQGKKPSFPKLSKSHNLNGSVISAVDLIFGLGICAGMKIVEVEGATGNIHTNFAGKAQAAINEFKNNQDYVYLHIEAPDECGHRNELDGKIKSIELIDEKVLSPIIKYFEELKLNSGEDYRILVLPDHPTPISLRTHTADPVPFVLYSSDDKIKKPAPLFTEAKCAEYGDYYTSGPSLFNFFIDYK